MNKFLRIHTIFLICFILFCLLLFKDIFSDLTLVPNLEPFPDTIHYINPARSLLQGDGLNIVREGRALVPAVPPLYSLSLVPGFIINSDPRMFYFTNLILALLSFFIFYRILIKLISSSLIKGFVLFLYVTNYYLYWFPNLAMAENLILLLFNIFVLLILSKVSLLNVFFAGIVAVSFYATKYASVPLTGSFLFIYFIKLFFLWRKKEFKILGFFVFFSSVFLAFFALSISEYFTKGIIPFSFLITFGSNFSNQAITQASTSSWFSLTYVNGNIQHYFNALTGGSERFLWDFTPLVPKFVAFGGLLGLMGGLIFRKYRLVCSALLIALGSSIIFMSTFYSVDMRYISQTIPTLLIGFGIFLQLIIERLRNDIFKKIYYVVILMLAIFYLSTNILRIKNQIMLNIKHNETPWYYVSVLELNKYFTSDKILNGKKPIVISPMVPYYIDFYSNGNYSLLPLSLQQEFRGARVAAWGPNDYTDLIKLYKGYLESGAVLYVANYGLGNEGYLHSDFDNIKQTFNLTEVSTGCYNACNIYKLSLKKQTN